MIGLRFGSRMTGLARDALKKGIVRNILSLFGAQFANYLLPLVTVPYLARVLGPESWGVILFVQALGLYVVIVVNYSFDFSATREVARAKDDPQQLAIIVAGVLGSKLVLVALSIVVLALAQVLVSQIREAGWLLWLSVFWFSALGLQPLWYFLGIERLAPFMALNVSLRVLTVPAILLFVNSPSDAWLVLAFQGAATAGILLVSMGMIYRMVPFRAPSLAVVLSALKDGWKLFAFKTTESVFNMSNTVILGLLASTNVVAFYAGADRLINVGIALLQIPITAFYARASAHAKESLPETARVARRTVTVLFPLGAGACIFIFITAPVIVKVVFGPGYEEVVPVLRVLGLLLPVMGILRPLGGHWAIPLGMDGMLTRLSVSAACLHITLAVVLVSEFEHVGIAWAWVCTETYMLVVMTLLLLRRGMHPFSSKFSVKGGATSPDAVALSNHP